MNSSYKLGKKDLCTFTTHIHKMFGFNSSIDYVNQEGYIEELSICFYLDTALLKSSESLVSET